MRQKEKSTVRIMRTDTVFFQMHTQRGIKKVRLELNTPQIHDLVTNYPVKLLIKGKKNEWLKNPIFQVKKILNQNPAIKDILILNEAGLTQMDHSCQSQWDDILYNLITLNKIYSTSCWWRPLPFAFLAKLTW